MMTYAGLLSGGNPDLERTSNDRPSLTQLGHNPHSSIQQLSRSPSTMDIGFSLLSKFADLVSASWHPSGSPSKVSSLAVAVRGRTPTSSDAVRLWSCTDTIVRSRPSHSRRSRLERAPPPR